MAIGKIDTRTTTHLIHAFPAGERVVSMTEFRGHLIVATERAIYEVRGQEVSGKIEVAPLLSAEDLGRAHQAAPPKRSPRMQAALDSSFEAITKAAAEPAPEPQPTPDPFANPPPMLTTPAHARGAAWAEQRGWKRVRGRVPAGAQRKTFGGVKMWRNK